MPPKKRTLSPVRTAARKPVRTTDSSKPASSRGTTKKASNIRSLSPTRNYAGSKPPTKRQGSSNSNISSDDSAGSGGPLWRMPRRGGSGPAAPPKKQPKKFNSTPAKVQAPSKQETMKWQSNSEGDKRTGRTKRRQQVVIDVSSSEEGDSDSSIEILVPPKPQSAQVLGGRTPVRTKTEKRKSLPDRSISMNDKRPAKTPARGISPKPAKSFHDAQKPARGISPKPAKSFHDAQKPAQRKPIKRTSSFNSKATTDSTTSSDRSRSKTINDRNRGRSHSPVLFKESPTRTSKGTTSTSSKRGATASPVFDHASPSEQKKTAKFEKKKSPEIGKKEPARAVSPVRGRTPDAYPTLSPLVKEKQTVGSNRRQSTAVDGRAPVRERSPNRSSNLPGRRVASVATEERHTPPPSRPSNPPPQRNAPPPPVPKKAGFSNGGPTMSAPPVGQVDPRRMSTAVDGRPVRDRSPMRNQIPGRRVASMATEDTAANPTAPRSFNLGGGRVSSGSQMPGRRVASTAPDERPSIRKSAADDMGPPRRRSTATEDIPDRASRNGRSIRMGGSGTRPHASRSPPPPRSSSGRGGGRGGRGRGRGGPQPRQTEYDSIHKMPASLQNKYGAHLGRFASSGGRGGGATGRGGNSVFSGRVTKDGRKVPIAQVKQKTKVVLPIGGTPYATAARPPIPNPGRGAVSNAGRGGGRAGSRQAPPQSVRTTSQPPMFHRPSNENKGRTKRRDSGGGTTGSGISPARGSGARSPPNVPRPVSPVTDPDPSPRRKPPKIRTEEPLPFMFPIDNPDIINEIVQPGGSVRILICSANLGNAQPDELSLNEWVPEDGSMRYVLTTPQRYPVMLNFPTEEKKEDHVDTDRAIYHSTHTRPSQLLTINEHEFDLEDDSEIFALDPTEFISLPSSEILIETVDEEADDDDQSVIVQDTLEVKRSIRISNEAKAENAPSELIELLDIAEETEPEIADPDKPSEVADEEREGDNPSEVVEESEEHTPTEVLEEPEAAEPESSAVPDKEESPSEPEPVEEEPEETVAEVGEEPLKGPVEAEIQEDKSWIDNSGRSDEMDVPRRYTASSKKLDSIRQRIEASIKNSRTGGFEFGDAFHARQKSMLEMERLKSQEAKVRLHLGTMAPDTVTATESFLGQQTLTKSEEREKARQARAMMTRGSLGVVGKNSMRFQNITDEDDHFQAVPAQIRVASPVPESDDAGEAKDSNQVESESQKNSNGGGADENDAKDAVEPEQDDPASGQVDTQNIGPENVQTESGTSKDRATPAEHGAENVDEESGNSESEKPISSVAHSSDKESDEIDILEPNSPAIASDDKGVADGVSGEVDFKADDDGHAVPDNDHGGAQFDSSEDWQNNHDIVEPEPYYEDGPDDYFEIIVIGMQEATFDPDEDADGKESDKATVDTSERTADDGSDSDASDDDDEEGSEDETENGEEEDGEDDDPLTPQGSSDDDEDYDPPTSSKSMNGSGKDDLSPTRRKKFLQIAKNAGKKTLKAGGSAMKKGKKKLKAAQKTSKAVKTLMSARNHTKRELPFAREEEEDGAMTKWEDTDVLHFLFDGQLPSYERALSYQLGEMRLMVYYLKRSVELDVLSVKAKPTGKHNLANKGGIVTEVAVNRSTRLCFSSAHLEAHEGAKKFEKRCKSFERIFNAANSSVTALNFDPTMASHYSFFMGDLNFRTKLPSLEAGSDEHIQASHELAARKKWDVLNRNDELSKALADKKCLAGWKTPYCNFDPTFKVSREDGYKYNVLRSPSYTDRILYKAVDQLEDSVEVALYEPITHFTSSDHKPVRGAFEVQLTEKLDLKPRIPTKKKEKLHILFTSIELFLDSDKYKPSKKAKSEDEVVKPNPFVSFISTPRDALELDASSRKRSTWRQLGLKKSRTKPDRTKSKVTEAMFNPLSGQWPGSSVIEGTFTPKWYNEEIHFEVGMKNKTNNRPLDLSGAMMHVSVFDGRDSNPKLLGSFTLNLASLIKMTIESDNNRRGSTRHARAMGMKQGSGNSYERRLSRQPSSRLSGMINSLTEDLERDSQEKQRLKNMKITTLKFDEALVDSGIQTGTIKCTVDAWWMQEEEEE